MVRVGPRDLRGQPVSLEAALEAALEAGAQDVCPDEEEEEEEEPALKVGEERTVCPVSEQTGWSSWRPGCSWPLPAHSWPFLTFPDHHQLFPALLTLPGLSQPSLGRPQPPLAVP